MRFFTPTLTFLITRFVNTTAFVVLSSKSFTTELHAGETVPTASQLLKQSFDNAAASASAISATNPSGGDAKNILAYLSDEQVARNQELRSQLSDAKDQYGAQPSQLTNQLQSVTKQNAAAIKDSLNDLSGSIKDARISPPAVPDQLQSVTKQNAAAIKDSLKDISGSIQDISGSIKDASVSIKDAGDKVSPALQTISKSIEHLRLELTNGSSNLATKLNGFADNFSQLKPSSSSGSGGGDLTVAFNEFWDSLQITQNAPLYVAGIAVLVAGYSNRSKTNEVAEAKAKATEAANAAEIAAKGASLAKELAKSADADANKKEKELEAEKRAMESEVSKLKTESAQASEAAKKAKEEAKIVKEKSRKEDVEGSKMANQLKIENEMLAVKISRIEADNTMAMGVAAAKFTEASVEKETAEKNYAEASRKAKELESEKEIMRADISKLKADITKATESSQITAREASIAKETAESNDAEARGKVQVLEAEKIKMEGEISKLQEETTDLKKKETAESNDAEARGKVQVLEAEKIKMEGEISKLQEETTELKKVVDLLMSTKQDSTKVPVAVKTATVTAVKTSGGSDSNPWGSLKESTLKGRNKAQLTAYLEERNVDVAGMKKADLIITIQNL